MINRLPRILPIRIWGDFIMFDNLIVDIFGMVMIAICLTGLVPARRAPGRCIRDV
jgi:hypothetical protein